MGSTSSKPSRPPNKSRPPNQKQNTSKPTQLTQLSNKPLPYLPTTRHYPTHEQTLRAETEARKRVAYFQNYRPPTTLPPTNQGQKERQRQRQNERRNGMVIGKSQSQSQQQQQQQKKKTGSQFRPLEEIGRASVRSSKGKGGYSYPFKFFLPSIILIPLPLSFHFLSLNIYTNIQNSTPASLQPPRIPSLAPLSPLTIPMTNHTHSHYKHKVLPKVPPKVPPKTTAAKPKKGAQFGGTRQDERGEWWVLVLDGNKWVRSRDLGLKTL